MQCCVSKDFSLLTSCDSLLDYKVVISIKRKLFSNIKMEGRNLTDEKIMSMLAYAGVAKNRHQF